MSPNERLLLASKLRSAHEYFEFGCGGSTLLAARVANEDQSSLRMINSADSSFPWLEKLKNDTVVASLLRARRLALHHINIGEIGEWGHPDAKKKKVPLWKQYSATVWQYGRTADLVLVDGRFRISSALQTLYAAQFSLNTTFADTKKASSSILERRDLVIMMHDFTHRKYYHKVLNYMDVIDCVDALVAMKPKAHIDMESLRKDIFRSRNEPI
eukprot:CAMPEP_0201108916 /NCGR_PEP_ID=MMETSP0812-20130820/63607_1 /ASSEMBLY_ACC=CAM_ASM_000668 /TAXON_ID=98059 /ORGANISM="Dinobryon sp., Strain UTEXLB2267" /LENGTH=213 /DNA_ID=CAMNT_0047370601 /DNA_START=91 /DNA_END=732 /DNA_ORIENTATION=+